MLTARRLQLLLLIPTIASLCYVYIHIWKQSRLANWAPRGDDDASSGSSENTESSGWNESPSNHVTIPAYDSNPEENGSSLEVGPPPLANNTVVDRPRDDKLVPDITPLSSMVIDDTERVLNTNVSSSLEVFKRNKTNIALSYKQYKAIDKYNAISNTEISDADVKPKNVDFLMGAGCGKGPAFNHSTRFRASNASKCTPYYKVLDVCAAENSYYPATTRNCKRKCTTQSGERICRLTNSNGTRIFPKVALICNISVCNKTAIAVSIIDSRYGVVKQPTYYRDARSLENGVRNAVIKSWRNGFHYIFLSCKIAGVGKGGKIDQVLFLPPTLQKSRKLKVKSKINGDSTRNSDPNINVIVLDSISRAHFSRVLPRTAHLLKEAAGSNRGITVADFAYFQSLAPFTFVNVKSFMTGKQQFGSVQNRDLGFNEMFGALKKRGYQTTVQEDTCWYDKWGSVITSNSKRSRTLRTWREIGKGWGELTRVVKKSNIDGVGLTHLSCYVLRKYKRTNMFNEGPSFCEDGKPLSAHFLRYAKEIHRQQETNADIKPQFTYTHINIAHESSGKRACAIDEDLAETVSKLFSLNNTVTIMWSDHGAKTTPYSIYSLPGKFETQDAFLFVSVPHNVKKRLGNHLHKTFLENQGSVVSAVDLHTTVQFLSAINEMKLEKKRNDLGLFSSKAWRRGCENIPIRGYSLCKCVNNYEFPDLNSRSTYFDILWMAEFAIGELNNKLSSQAPKTGGRKCEWLHALSFRDVIFDRGTTASAGRHIFDVLVNHKRIQVFNVQIKKLKAGLSLSHWQRTSIYREFDGCRDANVSLELCVCAKKAAGFSFKQVLAIEMFGSGNNFSFPSLGLNCLMLVERNHQGEVVSFSVANFCGESYKLHVSKPEQGEWEASKILPINVTSLANSVVFILSVRRRKPGNGPYRLKVRLA